MSGPQRRSGVIPFNMGPPTNNTENQGPPHGTSPLMGPDTAHTPSGPVKVQFSTNLSAALSEEDAALVAAVQGKSNPAALSRPEPQAPAPPTTALDIDMDVDKEEEARMPTPSTESSGYPRNPFMGKTLSQLQRECMAGHSQFEGVVEMIRQAEMSQEQAGFLLDRQKEDWFLMREALEANGSAARELLLAVDGVFSQIDLGYVFLSDHLLPEREIERLVSEWENKVVEWENRQTSALATSRLERDDTNTDDASRRPGSEGRHMFDPPFFHRQAPSPPQARYLSPVAASSLPAQVLSRPQAQQPRPDMRMRIPSDHSSQDSPLSPALSIESDGSESDYDAQTSSRPQAPQRQLFDYRSPSGFHQRPATQPSSAYNITTMRQEMIASIADPIPASQFPVHGQGPLRDSHPSGRAGQMEYEPTVRTESPMRSELQMNDCESDDCASQGTGEIPATIDPENVTMADAPSPESVAMVSPSSPSPSVEDADMSYDAIDREVEIPDAASDSSAGVIVQYDDGDAASVASCMSLRPDVPESIVPENAVALINAEVQEAPTTIPPTEVSTMVQDWALQVGHCVEPRGEKRKHPTWRDQTEIESEKSPKLSKREQDHDGSLFRANEAMDAIYRPIPEEVSVESKPAPCEPALAVNVPAEEVQIVSVPAPCEPTPISHSLAEAMRVDIAVSAFALSGPTPVIETFIESAIDEEQPREESGVIELVCPVRPLSPHFSLPPIDAASLGPDEVEDEPAPSEPVPTESALTLPEETEEVVGLPSPEEAPAESEPVEIEEYWSMPGSFPVDPEESVAPQVGSSEEAVSESAVIEPTPASEESVSEALTFEEIEKSVDQAAVVVEEPRTPDPWAFPPRRRRPGGLSHLEMLLAQCPQKEEKPDTEPVAEADARALKNLRVRIEPTRVSTISSGSRAGEQSEVEVDPPHSTREIAEEPRDIEEATTGTTSEVQVPETEPAPSSPVVNASIEGIVRVEPASSRKVGMCFRLIFTVLVIAAGSWLLKELEKSFFHVVNGPEHVLEELRQGHGPTISFFDRVAYWVVRLFAIDRLLAG